MAYQGQVYSKNSSLTRKTQIKKYLKFVELFGIDRSPLPCSMVQVALYATWLARSLRYSSITNYLSGLNYFFKLHEFLPIDFDNYILSSTLRGIRRVKGDTPKRALPLLPNLLLKIFAFLLDTAGHVAWRAAVLCSFRGLLRKAHITDSDSSLLREDFRFYDWGVIITIKRSKTIQFGERIVEIPIARCSDKRLCAVFWSERHFRQLPADPKDKAFRIPTSRGGNLSKPFPYSNFQDTLRLFANKAGLDACQFSSHSLRRGGCTFLSMCGASIEEIKIRGDWASDTVYKYLMTPLGARIVLDIKVASTLGDYPLDVGLGGV